MKAAYINMGLVFLVLLMLTGCSSEKKLAQKIFDHLEKAANLEEGFNKQQQPLVDAEKKEQDLYGQIIQLDMTNYDKIVELSDEALDSISNRQDMLEKEKESMDKAYKEFSKALPLAKDIKDEKIKKDAQKTFDTMKKRYDEYNKLHDSYAASIEDDKKLYEMLKDKKLEIEDLQKQIDTVNENYKKVNETKDTFNTLTDEFNQDKKQFYKATSIKIKE